MAKAWLSAVAAMSVGMALYLASVKAEAASFISAAVYWATPTVGAFIAAYVSPRHKFNVGAGTILLAAVILGIGNFIFGELGNGTDLPGLQGSLIVAAFSLPMVAIPCIIGALAGEWVSRRRADA